MPDLRRGPEIPTGFLAGGPAVALHDGRLADLAPSLLALMDLPPPQEMTGKPLLG